MTFSVFQNSCCCCMVARRLFRDLMMMSSPYCDIIFDFTKLSLDIISYSPWHLLDYVSAIGLQLKWQPCCVMSTLLQRTWRNIVVTQDTTLLLNMINLNESTSFHYVAVVVSLVWHLLCWLCEGHTLSVFLFYSIFSW